MPKMWYLISVVGFLFWGSIIYWFASQIPVRPKTVEFFGTLLTLLPVALDLARRFYVHIKAPESKGEFEKWVDEQIRNSLLGYEWLYAALVFFGVSLIALGFAMDLLRPEVPHSVGACQGSYRRGSATTSIIVADELC